MVKRKTRTKVKGHRRRTKYSATYVQPHERKVKRKNPWIKIYEDEGEAMWENRNYHLKIHKYPRNGRFQYRLFLNKNYKGCPVHQRVLYDSTRYADIRQYAGRWMRENNV